VEVGKGASNREDQVMKLVTILWYKKSVKIPVPMTLATGTFGDFCSIQTI